MSLRGMLAKKVGSLFQLMITAACWDLVCPATSGGLTWTSDSFDTCESRAATKLSQLLNYYLLYLLTVLLDSSCKFSQAKCTSYVTRILGMKFGMHLAHISYHT